MKMVWIICNESIAEEVMEILDNDGISGYTVWQDVLGKDTRNGRNHWGNDIFPGRNWVFMILCEEANVSSLKDKLKNFEKDPYIKKAGLKVLMNNAEEIL